MMINIILTQSWLCLNVYILFTPINYKMTNLEHLKYFPVIMPHPKLKMCPLWSIFSFVSKEKSVKTQCDIVSFVVASCPHYLDMVSCFLHYHWHGVKATLPLTWCQIHITLTPHPPPPFTITLTRHHAIHRLVASELQKN